MVAVWLHNGTVYINHLYTCAYIYQYIPIQLFKLRNLMEIPWNFMKIRRAKLDSELQALRNKLRILPGKMLDPQILTIHVVLISQNPQRRNVSYTIYHAGAEVSWNSEFEVLIFQCISTPIATTPQKQSAHVNKAKHEIATTLTADCKHAPSRRHTFLRASGTRVRCQSSWDAIPRSNKKIKTDHSCIIEMWISD